MSAAPEGRRLLRLEIRNSETPIERKPEWIRTKAKMGPEYTALQQLVKSEDLHTVCQEAGCPNIFECWEDREATFLIGGDSCTRRCDFCQIESRKPSGYDKGEPLRVAESVQTMGLRYATVTGVCRDDLEDEGAWLYAETIRQIHTVNPGVGVEMLAPDFSGHRELLQQLFDTKPEVFAHNVETVPRIFRRIRPGFTYDRSLEVLRWSREEGLVTKSNLILGMGETREEITQALHDLHDAGTELITITQYLRPSPRHHPIDRWVTPEEFGELEQEATEIGFVGVLSGPLVRSSYRAGRLYRTAIEARRRRERDAGKPANGAARPARAASGTTPANGTTPPNGTTPANGTTRIGRSTPGIGLSQVTGAARRPANGAAPACGTGQANGTTPSNGDTITLPNGITLSMSGGADVPNGATTINGSTTHGK